MNESLIELKEALKKEIQEVDFTQLQKSRSELSAKYREKNHGKRFMQSQNERLSYLATRMPATAAVIKRVAKEMKVRQPDINFESILDLGAGPGTALWAFASIFSVKKATMIEQDVELIELGRKLMLQGSQPCFKNATWEKGSVLNIPSLIDHDCVIFSYVLNEIPKERHSKILEEAWKLTRKNLVLIEPGTPKGYQIILSARKQLISLGAYIIAPCPHKANCPLADTSSKWCHFSERLERSREHRLVKGGQLGYEDEKYSYIIFSKNPQLEYSARILSHPQKRSGHINMEFCMAEGWVAKTISKRDKESFKKAKKLDWGDAWE